MRTAEIEARHRAKIKAADLGKDVDGVVGVWSMERQRLLDDCFFMRKRRIRDAAAALLFFLSAIISFHIQLLLLL